MHIREREKESERERETGTRETNTNREARKRRVARGYSVCVRATRVRDVRRRDTPPDTCFMCIYIYIYIYIERERGRERCKCMCIYIYIYRCLEGDSGDIIIPHGEPMSEETCKDPAVVCR